MPICTSCTHPTPYLYTVYQSAYNLRLEQCVKCHAFADPYIEHDTLTLLLDLILLKRDVYRHLLFNRGLGARRADDQSHSADYLVDWRQCREKARWWLIVKLGAALIAVDAFIRWAHLNTGAPSDRLEEIVHWNRDSLECFVRILGGCLFETVAFHAGIVLACHIVFECLNRARRWKPRVSEASQTSGISQEFRYSHVPLTLLYSSLTKLFLLFLLSIWRPNSHNEPQFSAEVHESITFARVLSLLNEDTFDREWVVRNVLGGMAAGFGLRVVLNCHPVFTTIIILAGWAIKTMAAQFVSQWVELAQGRKVPGDMWLAYSIP